MLTLYLQFPEMRFLGFPLQLGLPSIWTLAQVGGKAFLLIGHKRGLSSGRYRIWVESRTRTPYYGGLKSSILIEIVQSSPFP